MLNEELALKCLCEIAARTCFPDAEIERKVVLSAEEKMSEYLTAHPAHEFHSAEAEHVLYELDVLGKPFKDVAAQFGRYCV